MTRLALRLIAGFFFVLLSGLFFLGFFHGRGPAPIGEVLTLARYLFWGVVSLALIFVVLFTFSELFPLWYQSRKAGSIHDEDQRLLIKKKLKGKIKELLILFIIFDFFISLSILFWSLYTGKIPL